MPRPVLVAALCLAWGGLASAHEHWITAQAAATPTGGPWRVSVCSGHAFPRSETRLAERLLSDLQVAGPRGAPRALKPVAGEQAWTADVAFDEPGVWVASFALRKPPQNVLLYAGRSLSVVGELDDPARYASGSGLEVVPLAPLSTLRPGGGVPVAVHVDGRPIAGRIGVTPPADRPVSFLSTGRERPAQVKLPVAGVYLLTASHGGTTFALTFTVAPPPAAAGERP